MIQQPSIQQPSKQQPSIERKKLMATIYLKNGVAVRGKDSDEVLGSAEELARIYNDSGIDQMVIWDLSETTQEHEHSLKLIREINRVLEISSYAYGWTENLRDIREYLYAGCRRVIISSNNPNISKMIEEHKKQVYDNRLSLALEDVDILFKRRTELLETFHDIYVFRSDILDSVVNMTELPFYAFVESMEFDAYKDTLKLSACLGVGGPLLDEQTTDIMTLKHELYEHGILVLINDASMEWSAFKLDSNGLIAVVAQDYSTKEVLNYGYMNKEAFEATIAKGKMHYYNKQTGKMHMHGQAQGHMQYVKSLSVDCHKQAILAKVSQIGVACHTGNYSCFYKEIMKKDFTEKNTFKLLENIYNVIINRKKHPQEGSFTNFLLDKGLNEISKKIQAETTELILSAKDQDVEALRTELSDLIYYMMVLMSEYDITWDDVTNELAQRK